MNIIFYMKNPTGLVKHNRWEILTLSSCNLRELLVGEVDIFNFVGYIHGGFLYPFLHCYYVGEVALFNLIKPQFQVLGATESSSTIQPCLETCLSDTLQAIIFLPPLPLFVLLCNGYNIVCSLIYIFNSSLWYFSSNLSDMHQQFANSISSDFDFDDFLLSCKVLYRLHSCHVVYN